MLKFLVMLAAFVFSPIVVGAGNGGFSGGDNDAPFVLPASALITMGDYATGYVGDYVLRVGDAATVTATFNALVGNQKAGTTAQDVTHLDASWTCTLGLEIKVHVVQGQNETPKDFEDRFARTVTNTLKNFPKGP